MMAQVKDTKPIHMVRKGLSLVPELEMDADALTGIPNGHGVRVTVQKSRSLPRMRAYWAMLHEVVEATGCAPSAERLHEAMKLELGIVDLVKVGKLTVAIPGSIAFDKMTEAEMTEFFRIAEGWLAETYGFVPERERAA